MRIFKCVLIYLIIKNIDCLSRLKTPFDPHILWNNIDFLPPRISVYFYADFQLNSTYSPI